ncbi:hypothetical protein [Haladaptatus sp. DYSN1]|uniref:DUF7550 family protein n=1 Tax=unclassified Haladaptatus TaxID=2622732 RepID=UPI0024052A86|nr:hypothetical protein [Haladaptatus sp. DYSN1]
MDEHSHDDDHGGHGEHHEGESVGRVTSPMQEFTMGQVTTGFIVTLIGVALVFGLAFVMA